MLKYFYTNPLPPLLLFFLDVLLLLLLLLLFFIVVVSCFINTRGGLDLLNFLLKSEIMCNDTHVFPLS